MPSSWLLASFVLTALVYMLAQPHAFRGKPLAKAAPILMLAALTASAVPTPYKWWVLLALLFSAGGDVALELDGERYFVVGLGLFLIAHLFYTVALGQTISFTPVALLPLIIIVLIAGVLIKRLYPRLGGLRVPVLLYIGIIIAMGVTASLHAPFNTLLAVGAIVFMLSDATIAIHKFLQPVPRRDFIVMATYYSAQLLLVMGFLA